MTWFSEWCVLLDTLKAREVLITIRARTIQPHTVQIWEMASLRPNSSLGQFQSLDFGLYIIANSVPLNFSVSLSASFRALSLSSDTDIKTAFIFNLFRRMIYMINKPAPCLCVSDALPAIIFRRWHLLLLIILWWLSAFTVSFLKSGISQDAGQSLLLTINK